MSTDAIIWDNSGGDTFCRMCGGCGYKRLQQLSSWRSIGVNHTGHDVNIVPQSNNMKLVHWPFMGVTFGTVKRSLGGPAING